MRPSNDQEARMKRYDMLQMSLDKGHITLICTDMDRLNLIVEGVKSKFPYCRVNTFDLLLDWMPYMYIDKLQKREFEAAWWIVQELSHSGWRLLYLSPVYPSTFSANFEIEIV